MKKIYVAVVFIFFFNLLDAQNPELWGMTSEGGLTGDGVIFKINGDGTGFIVKHNFIVATGFYPEGNLVKATNGKLYGMTTYGGLTGAGVIFSYDLTTNSYTDLFHLNNSSGIWPRGSLIEATNGLLYGLTTVGGNTNDGTLFSFDPVNNVFTKLFDFGFTNGRYPYGSLMQSSNGKLYGMTSGGGLNYSGVIFSFDPDSNIFTKLYDFNGIDGEFPWGDLFEASNGLLYGLVREGGTDTVGVLFSLDTINYTYSKLIDFNWASGAFPRGNLAQANNGMLYGTTVTGAVNNFGNIFSFDLNNNVFTSLYNFTMMDGINPSDYLLEASNGKLFGTHEYGGANSTKGVVFSFDPVNNNYSVLHDFNGSDGEKPYGSLIEILPTLGFPILNFAFPISISPNPFTEELVVSSPEPGEIKIYDIYGRLIYAQKPAAGSLRLATGNWAAGIYFVEVITDEGRVVRKVVKQ